MTRLTETGQEALEERIDDLEPRECETCGRTVLDDPTNDAPVTCENHPI